MQKAIIQVLILFTANYTLAQLPVCIKMKCDSILISELGADVYAKSIKYVGYECTEKLETVKSNSCISQTPSACRVNYIFQFPSQTNASFNLGFHSTSYQGKIYIQSEYFYRMTQSDLPINFIKSGLDIVDYHKIVKKALKANPKVNSQGKLALDQKKIYWIFSGRTPYINPNGIGDESMIVHIVTIDPYSGKVISNSSRRE